MSNNIYIIGGSGFIGQHLISFFSENAKNNVFCIAKSKPKHIHSSMYRYLDIDKDDYEIENESIVINLVHISSEVEELKIKQKIEKNNPKKIIVFSSAAVYTNGRSNYKDEKLLQENIWKDNSNVCIVRLFNVFGEYQIPYRKGSLVANIFCNYLKGKATDINDPTAIRNFIYAGDIGKFLSIIINKDVKGTVDIGSETNMSIRDLLTPIYEIIGKGSINLLNTREKVFDKIPKLDFKIDYTEYRKALSKTFSFYKNNN